MPQKNDCKKKKEMFGIVIARNFEFVMVITFKMQMFTGNSF